MEKQKKKKQNRDKLDVVSLSSLGNFNPGHLVHPGLQFRQRQERGTQV